MRFGVFFETALSHGLTPCPAVIRTISTIARGTPASAAPPGESAHDASSSLNSRTLGNVRSRSQIA
jgi:hypothetical protein